jgi:sugar lactone lactonase YvrE
MSTLNTLMTGIAFGESPRWHDGRLWFSDFGAHEVIAVDLEGRGEVIARVPGMPMGLGFLPDDRLLVVSARDGRLLAAGDTGSQETYAGLSGLSGHPWSDMVIDGRGYAYIGNIGFDFPAAEFAPGILALVTPDGAARQVASGLAFPNGMVITPDGTTLILAETYGHRLVAFDIAADGSLTGQRVWAGLPGAFPDGICLDADGAVWYADVPGKRCVRVAEGGKLLQSIDLDRGCFACALGGPGRRTLFLMAAEYPGAAGAAHGERTGQVLTAPAPAPGAGWP